MLRFRIHSRVKMLSYAALGVVLLNSANAYATVSQSPLSLTVGVPPNMLLTLDDSGSMRWAFAPDNKNGYSATRRAKSSTFNPIYYNPEANYRAPITFDASGEENQLSTSFTSALVNGYNSARGNLDLSDDYKVSWTYVLEENLPTSYGYSSTSNRLAENPSSDFSCSVTNLSNRQEKTCETDAGEIITIRRNNSGRGCTASTDGWADGDCTYSNNTGRYTGSWTRSGVPAYYYVYNSAKDANCKLDEDDCYTLKFVDNDEQQNFANWYSFYRNRALATVSAAALAFYDLSPAIRLSWQGLGRCTKFDGTDSNCRDNAFKAYSPEHKGQLYAWLQNINFNQSTYLPAAMKRAGEFFTTTTPWQKNPNGTDNTTQNTYACRASYHIMMTDGLWNESVSAPGSFRHDAAKFNLPDGQRSYTSQTPYHDSQSNTLADLAMHYWATDLNPNLDDELPPFLPFKSGDSTTDYWDPRNDPATWQHMTNFMMGLGLTEAMDRSDIPWEGSTHRGFGYESLVAGTATWPAASSDGGNNNVYDLWHAAINSRGEFFSVDSPETMVQAFDDILSRIADRKATAARPAINSGQISADENNNGTVKTVSYQTSYASDDNWSGDVKRFEKAWDSESGTFETREIWSAKSQVPGWQTRTIKIAGDTNSGLVDFSWDNAGASNTTGTLAKLLSRDPENGNSADALGEQRLQYLRGNRNGEGTTFRQRSGLLGDFYSSSPAVVSGPRYLINFTNKLEGNNAYSTFAEDIAGRPSRLYVGGNDGMLHGFNAQTGVEEFAFIPSAVFPKLNKLTGSNYSHEFYVEGTPVVADVFNGTEWRTILVGTLKAGGRSIFALDITSPGSEKLLWEFDDNSLPDDAEVKMGYSFSQPTVARLHTGEWTVVFGNGYESANNTNGKAALFIVDAMEGTLLKSLEVEGLDGTANGLSTPKLGDYNADGVADYAYAGDLQGNVWRFDLLRNGRSDSAPFTTEDDGENVINDFEVAFGGEPLFSAVDDDGDIRQPITSAPSLVRHPTGFGYLVVFGTGKFFETGDKAGDKNFAQTVYGIWDKQTLGEEASDPNINRSSLQEQEIVTQTTVEADGSTRQGRVVSDNSVRWNSGPEGSPAAQNGWYLNLKQSDGEMVVENMSQLGRTVFFQSLVPNDDPCGDGATNWTYAINPFTGGRTFHQAFDYKPTTDMDEPISAIRQDGEGGGTLSQDSDSSYQYCTGQECLNIYPDPASLGRQTWRRVEEE
ncbi:pilus assembly protein PilY [Stutzerimonas stutzeri]|uniref:Pilus assembly protein PilY n=1 Tax=Stutzerimonas stutzeri TaxID=316 RepID=W8RQG8_STUST|nr:PilC/PilY family type IV pilus protein [Stutzerimonas stutzeri]AHL74286.1 pilus assembly protein PilY [Stutzerimonas stutzeri]MCQ4330775.1 PilC/PilY family type IV pilus protein [Stutzerimonas stutzeri]